ncbi:MAG: isochorismate synthase [Acidimicrobiia bacterium]|nr:isochorismate synthase [Acidimicrobiia bacterium]MYC58088.1 isochorismate synthase [Acidimicrobiia bacterium]MYG93827.1 isochorismate synthase [Acidimicrobiia bacterium]MYI30739.1 isochorismate synthase [Acidimicrobiia bacterium]
MNPLEEFASWSDDDRVYWRAPGVDAMVGLGAARVVEVDGVRRFTAAAAAAAELLDEGEIAFAGFGFADRPGTGEWEGYPSGRLVVPKRVVRGAALGVSGTGTNNALRIEDSTRASYRDTVKHAAEAINAGELAKVVVARTVDAIGPVDPTDVIARLSRRFESCVVFGFGRGPLCFLGASPEVLLELQDDLVTTFALAGTAPRGANSAQDQANIDHLISNPKEQSEHRYVVEYLRTRLALAGVDLDPVGPTEVRTLPGIHHLSTKVTGRIVPEPGGVLRLVGALHPTPAVGGTPTTFAQQWISQNEELERGWYAGPVGWIDHRGCGSFYVALRSALASPEGLRLFAGAGIVASSDPEQELIETDLKLTAILDVVT